MSLFKQNTKAEPPRIILYGESGIGKSEIASTLPKPAFLQLEKGIGHLTHVFKTDLLTTYEQVIQALTELRDSPHDFKTAVIDTLDWLDMVLIRSVCEEYGVSAIGDISYGKGYAYLEERWSEITKLLTQLQDKGMINFHLAHCKVENKELPGIDSFASYDLDFSKHGRSLMVEWADAVLFARYDVTVMKDGNNKGKVVGDSERSVYTSGSASYRAKNRFSLPQQIPIEEGKPEEFWKTVKPFILKKVK